MGLHFETSGKWHGTRSIRRSGRYHEQSNGAAGCHLRVGRTETQDRSRSHHRQQVRCAGQLGVDAEMEKQQLAQKRRQVLQASEEPRVLAGVGRTVGTA
ncbi:UNVERIFIED_CONTAM: hypothetical protein GTU68_061893 [Idotea baltica]|nr:hypothetical protein [Idotea baltica]